MRFLLLFVAIAIATVAGGQVSLPYSQTFDATTMPTGWTTQQNVGHDDPAFDWAFGTDSTTGAIQTVWDISPVLTGNYAIVNNGRRAGNYSDTKNLDLISPNITLSGVDMVNLQFNHFFYWENDAVGTISYSTDGGTSWTSIGVLNSVSTNPALFNYMVDGLTGETQIQFKLNFTGTLNYGWAVDDFSVTEGSAVQWTGDADTDWNNMANWNPANIPGTTTNVFIPDGATNYPVVSDIANAYKIVMAANASLVIGPAGQLTVYDEFAPANVSIETDGTDTGSLIAKGTVAGTGTVGVQRYVQTPDRWYLASAPVNQLTSSFLSNNPLILEKPDNVTRAMMDFNTTTDTWNTFFENNQAGTLESGKGYAIQTGQTGIVNFSGTLKAGEVAVSLSRDNYRWNLVGNPYTSAIILNRGALNRSTFLMTNMDVLEDEYVGVYAWTWNGIEYTYVAVNLASGDWDASLAQGFFVKAKSGSTGDLVFTPEMQVHTNEVTLKSEIVYPELKLTVSHLDKTRDTQIKFIENMTAGLDVGYDAGILKADPDFSLFTRLVEDNNVEFMLQCLPLPSVETMVIPLGIDFREGGELTFKAEMLNLPEGSKVVLEDRLLQKFTTFDNANSKYQATVDANAEPTGRFFVHVSGKAQVTAIDDGANVKKVNAWMDGNELVISGTSGNNRVMHLFDVQGRSVLTRNLEKTGINRVNVSAVKPGIYMLQVIEDGQRTGIKLNIAGN